MNITARGNVAVLLLGMFLGVGCAAPATRNFRIAKNEDTVGAYRRFVNSHPYSQHTDEARQLLDATIVRAMQETRTLQVTVSTEFSKLQNATNDSLIRGILEKLVQNVLEEHGYQVVDKEAEASLVVAYVESEEPYKVRQVEEPRRIEVAPGVWATTQAVTTINIWELSHTVSSVSLTFVHGRDGELLKARSASDDPIRSTVPKAIEQWVKETLPHRISPER